MKTQKRLFILFAIVSIITIVILFILEYLPKGIVNFQLFNGRRDFYINILIGIFGGTVVATLTSYITYKQERENLISNIISCLMTIYDNLLYLKQNFKFDSTMPTQAINSEVDYDVEHINIILNKCRFLLYDIDGLESLINKKDKEKFENMYARIRTIHCWGCLLSRQLRNPFSLENVINLINGINTNINSHIDIEENIKDMGRIINNKKQQVKFEKHVDDFRDNHPNYNK